MPADHQCPSHPPATRPNWPIDVEASKHGFIVLAHHTAAIDNLRRTLEAALTHGNGPSFNDRALGVLQRDFAAEVGIALRRGTPKRRGRKPVDYTAEAARTLMRAMDGLQNNKTAADTVATHIIAIRTICADIADAPFKHAKPRPELGQDIYSALVGDDVVFCRVWPKAALVLAILPARDDYLQCLCERDAHASRHAALWLTDGIKEQH